MCVFPLFHESRSPPVAGRDLLPNCLPFILSSSHPVRSVQSFGAHLTTGLDNSHLHSHCRALRGILNFTAAPQRKIAVLQKQTRAAIGIVDPSGFHPGANPGLLLRLKIAAPK